MKSADTRSNAAFVNRPMGSGESPIACRGYRFSHPAKSAASLRSYGRSPTVWTVQKLLLGRRLTKTGRVCRTQIKSIINARSGRS